MISTVHIDSISPGNVLAKSIYDAESKLLLREGVKLDEKLIGILGSRKLCYVQIVDECPDSLSSCESCQAAINLQLPTHTEDSVTTFVCRGCNAIYFGANPAPGSSLEPVDVLLKPTRKVALSKRLDDAFNRSWVPNGVGSERRTFKRHVVTVPVTVVPLSKYFRVVGESVQLTTQDISQGGICLKTTEEIYDPFLYLELQLTGRRLRKIAEVVRMQRHGQACEIGCRFIDTVEGNTTETVQLCSVNGCGKIAHCEVLWQTICETSGNIYQRPDNNCPYLCRNHLLENERKSQRTTTGGETVRYPYTNQYGKVGVTLYKPLENDRAAQPDSMKAESAGGSSVSCVTLPHYYDQNT